MRQVIRVYWNTKDAAPLVWSVDTGDGTDEVIVRGIRCYTPTFSKENIKNTDKMKPSGWFTTIGVLRFDNEVAVITEK